MLLFLGVAFVASGLLNITSKMEDPLAMSQSRTLMSLDAIQFSGWLWLVSAILIIGAMVNYERVFLKGARAKS